MRRWKYRLPMTQDRSIRAVCSQQMVFMKLNNADDHDWYQAKMPGSRSYIQNRLIASITNETGI